MLLEGQWEGLWEKNKDGLKIKKPSEPQLPSLTPLKSGGVFSGEGEQRPSEGGTSGQCEVRTGTRGRLEGVERLPALSSSLTCGRDASPTRAGTEDPSQKTLAEPGPEEASRRALGDQADPPALCRTPHQLLSPSFLDVGAQGRTTFRLQTSSRLRDRIQSKQQRHCGENSDHMRRSQR